MLFDRSVSFRISSLFLLLFFVASLSVAQTPTSSSTSSPAPSGLSVLQSSFQALTGNTTIADVTLTGSAEWIAGSDEETGTATYKATAGANRLDMTFSGGSRSEFRSSDSTGPTGAWIGLNGVSQPISNHNLLVDPGWFPIFTLGNIISSGNSVLVYIGRETRNDVSVIHLRSSQQFPNVAANSSSIYPHLTQIDIYLDSSTLLPVSYLFNDHPDNNAAADISTEIRYSDYRNVSGSQVPFHLQKFINNSLTVDIQVQNASLNTGVTISPVTVQ